MTLTSNAIEYAESNGIDDRKKMGGFYRSVKGVRIPSCYKVAIITRACAVVKSRKEERKRGMSRTRRRKALRSMVCIMTGYFVTATGRLFVSLGPDRYEMIQLNRYVFRRVTQDGVKIRSLTVRDSSISICYSKEVEPIEVNTVFGVDRNERNITFGNYDRVSRVNLSEVVRVNQVTREVVESFKRDDDRVREELASKYWRRAKHRIGQVLHNATNFIVDEAVENGAALAMEDIREIRKMYQEGNGQGANRRFRLNSWPFSKAQRMLVYKSAWKGVTVLQLTVAETRGSSSTHVCGKRLRSPTRGDIWHRRMLWCEECRVWVDRDVNASMTLSTRGLARLASSLPHAAKKERAPGGEKGGIVEAVRGNQTTPAILRVDVSK